jgi:hypothetical protein
MIVPFFLPTRSADLLCTARMPEGEKIAQATLLLAAGGRPAHNPLFTTVTGELIDRGHAVFTMEYPGVGSGPPAIEDTETREIIADGFQTLQAVTRLMSWSVFGLCLGALVGLSLAAGNHRIHTMVGFGCPFMQRAGQSGTTPNRGRLGRLTALLGRDRAVKPTDPVVLPRAVADLERASGRSDVHLIFGSEDAAGLDYKRLIESGQVTAEVAARVNVHQRDGLLTTVDTSASSTWTAAIAVDTLSAQAGRAHV